MSSWDMSGYHSGIDTWADANEEISSLKHKIAGLESALHTIAGTTLSDFTYQQIAQKALEDYDD